LEFASAAKKWIAQEGAVHSSGQTAEREGVGSEKGKDGNSPLSLFFREDLTLLD